MQTFGERVRITRLRKGILQNKLAEAAGVSAASLNLLEKGRNKMARADVALRIADELQVDPYWLVMGLDRKNGNADIEPAALARVIRFCETGIQRLQLDIPEDRRAAVIAAMYHIVTAPSADDETIFGLSMALTKSERSQ